MALAPATAVQLDSVGLHISSATSHGRPLRFRQDGESVCFQLPQPTAAGSELTLALTWQADPRAKGLHFLTDQAWAVQATAAWLPTRLDLEQRATLKLTLNSKSGLELETSRSHGAFVEDRGSGSIRHTYEVTVPISPIRYGFAIGHFNRADYYAPGISLSAIGPLASDLWGVLGPTSSMYQILRDLTGVAPLHGRYTQVFVHGEAAGAALGMAVISDKVLRELHDDPNADSSVARELARQWFGVLVPCADQADLWLDEGFATFMVAVIKERRWGRTAYERELADWRVHSQQLRGHNVPVSLARPSEPRMTALVETRLRSPDVFSIRGALVLNKLRRELGERTFWDGIRRYVAEQAGKPTRTADLQSALSKVSGSDLQMFFERWVYAPADDL